MCVICLFDNFVAYLYHRRFSAFFSRTVATIMSYEPTPKHSSSMVSTEPGRGIILVSKSRGSKLFFCFNVFLFVFSLFIFFGGAGCFI